MTTEASLFNASAPYGLRPFDVSRDLRPVADLIESCFSETLGDDGFRYLRQMRAAARNPRFLSWAASVSEYVSLPLSGFVWEENGRVVGNLSLIPFNTLSGRIYLIANVAVHPDYRRRGIARELTKKALDHVRGRRRVESVWLHVRSDNPPAIQLYTAMGFQERARRTAWRLRPGNGAGSTPLQVDIRPRRAADWPIQQGWLGRMYPRDLAWNMPIKINTLQPGLWGALRSLISGVRLKHWVAEREGQILGVLSWQAGRDGPDQIWLAAPPQGEDLAVLALLGRARSTTRSRRTLALDFPAGQAVGSLEQTGFYAEQTLIWMERDLGRSGGANT